METLTNKKTIRFTVTALKWCFTLAAVYILLTLLLPSNYLTIKNYRFSEFEYRIVLLLIAIPVICVWFVAFWGYSKLQIYSQKVADTKEGSELVTLTKGIMWLAWSLPVNAIINRILTGIADKNNSFHSASVILINYLDLIMPFIAFVLIAIAAKGLISIAKLDIGLTNSRFVMLIFIIIGVLYCYLTLKSANLSSMSTTNNHYYLPAWLIILTIIIPYLYAWFLGLLASYELIIYTRKIEGIIYKRALTLLSVGLFSIIFSFILSQYINSIWPINGSIIFNYRLFLGILIRIMGGIGFIVLAVGANRLKRIEDV